MLHIELKVNYKTIRTIGVHNVSLTPIDKSLKTECPYDVWDLTDAANPLADRKYLGEIKHVRSDGAEVLAQKVLNMVVEYDLGDKK